MLNVFLVIVPAFMTLATMVPAQTGDKVAYGFHIVFAALSVICIVVAIWDALAGGIRFPHRKKKPTTSVPPLTRNERRHRLRSHIINGDRRQSM